jgi:hypothetical protein
MSNRRPGCLLFLAGAALCIVAGFAAGRRFSAARFARHGSEALANEQPVPTTRPLFSPPPAATPVPTPAETPLPGHLVIPPGQHTVARLYNGLQVRSSFEAEAGRLASIERETAASYALDLKLAIKVPVPSQTAAELAASAPALTGLLPKLPALLESAAVSKFYYGLYQNKTDVLRQNLSRLDALMARDTFYDTETILELADPQTKRRALLLQTAMNVDSDGSDPDRSLVIDTADPTFAPLTSYRWPRRTALLNPLLKVYQDRLDRLLADARLPLHKPNTAAIDALRNALYQMAHYSSLIAAEDPYIVLPGFMARQVGHPFGPHIGDLAIVIARGKLYPAIFGDIGPSDQLGEASLRIAQAVDPRATPARSPIDNLEITYLVFPGTAETPFGPPDLDKLRLRCQALLNEIGGSPAELFGWTNLLAPPATPTPTPTAIPSLAPGPTPALSAMPVPTSSAAPAVAPSPSPGISPAATPKKSGL